MENIEKLKYRVDALVQESDISASYIFEKLFTSKEAMEHKFPDKFPHMYKGEDLNFDRRDRRAEHSFCPFHGNQTTEGSAFAIFNDNKGFFCFNSDCLYSDRKSTRLNSSHVAISYAVFCLKKKKKKSKLTQS